MTNTKIPLSKPSIDEREVEAAARVVRSGWLSQGRETALLEEEFGRYLDPKDPPFVVATSSCTTALELVLRAAGACPDVPVISPSYTFVASANAGRYCRAPVVLSDINLSTYNINPEALSDLVDRRQPHIIMAVHQVGLPCDVDGLLRASPRAVVVEDGACAIGARYPDGRRVGARGDTFATCFSLHGSKSIVAGEGGLIATRSRDTAELCRLLRQHGVNVAAENRKGAESEQYLELGYNYRMTDVQAAIARVQIEKADDIVYGRQMRAGAYSMRLADVCTVPGPYLNRHACQRYLIRVQNPVERDRLIGALTDAGIASRRGIQVVHRQPYWEKIPHGPLPNTELAADTTVQLPLWQNISAEEIGRVCDVVIGVLR